MTQSESVSTVKDYVWPADLPEGCPPEDAVPAQGSFYRFVNSATVKAKDFVRAIDRPNANYPPEEQCEASAISLFADPADVSLAKKLVPAFKSKKVAQGDLQPHMGVIKNTPMTLPDGTLFESHHDWWVAADYTVLPPFAVVTFP
jgi:hypothetical protein